MQIRIAETAGFCFGVNRAIQMIYALLDQEKTVFTLGPIIHNPQMVQELSDKGVVIVDNPSEVPPGGTLVIRSHGVPLKVMEEIKRCGLDYSDATCPFVAKIHRIVQKASNEGGGVLIAGDPSHPEVQGIQGYCNGISYVFKDSSELEKLLKNTQDLSNKPLTVVAQTTFSTTEWEKCVKIIKIVYTNAVIFDTICNATEERQKEAIDLSKNSDAMIIIGGRHSSNTAKLRDVCTVNCPTYLIETAEELPLEAVLSCNSIGVTAGASTPACIIKEVLKTMSEIQNDVTRDAATEEFNFMEALEESFKNLSTDQKVQGTVLRIEPTEIQVDIGRKHAGYIPAGEFSADPNVNPADCIKVGDTLDLIIMRTNDQEGTVMLSRKRYEALKGWDTIVKASEEETVLDGVVTDVIKGGVLVVTNGFKVFVPASLAALSRNEPLDELRNKPVRLRIIEINAGRKRAVGSIRSVLKEERKAQEEAFWNNVQIGQTYTGKVKSLTSYGAFVDLGGVDGMVHISELSWSRIKNPSEVVNVGDVVTVTIKDIDTEKKKISLSYKKTEDNPWEILKRDYPEGTVADAKIVSMTAFGAFAQIIPGIDGLIHISQIADRRINKPQDVLKIGDIVKVKITAIDFEKKRVSLSMRALLEEAPAVEEAPAADEQA